MFTSVAVCIGYDLAKAGYIVPKARCCVHNDLKQDLLTAGLKASFLHMCERMHMSVLCIVLCGKYDSAFFQHIATVQAQTLIPRSITDIFGAF